CPQAGADDAPVAALAKRRVSVERLVGAVKCADAEMQDAARDVRHVIGRPCHCGGQRAQLRERQPRRRLLLCGGLRCDAVPEVELERGPMVRGWTEAASRRGRET